VDLEELLARIRRRMRRNAHRQQRNLSLRQPGRRSLHKLLYETCLLLNSIFFRYKSFDEISADKVYGITKIGFFHKVYPGFRRDPLSFEMQADQY